jgi:hypothetical protein
MRLAQRVGTVRERAWLAQEASLQAAARARMVKEARLLAAVLDQARQTQEARLFSEVGQLVPVVEQRPVPRNPPLLYYFRVPVLLQLL